MTLSPAELKQFDELGYLFFPNCFNEEEIALLRDDAEAIAAIGGDDGLHTACRCADVPRQF